MTRQQRHDRSQAAKGSNRNLESRLLRLVGVDGSIFRHQHQGDASLSPDLLRQVVWGFNGRFDKRLPGCYILSSDPAHHDRVGSARFTRRGLLTAYRNHRPVKSHQRLAVLPESAAEVVGYGEHGCSLARTRFPD